jgi:pimeloyl-ACP methyl ester carboxylesterase
LNEEPDVTNMDDYERRRLTALASYDVLDTPREAAFDESDDVLDWSTSVAMMAALKPTFACAPAFSNTDFRPDLPAFRVPTLIVHGTADKTVPIDAAGRAAAHGIHQSQLVEYEGAPHGLNVPESDRLPSDLQHGGQLPDPIRSLDR